MHRQRIPNKQGFKDPNQKSPDPTRAKDNER